MERFFKYFLFPVIAIVALALVGAYLANFDYRTFSTSHDHWGQFSDYLGGLLNPTISFFTLLVAYQVWKLQKREMSETKKAIEEQAQTLEQQRAEQRFFDMLTLYRNALDGIENTKSQRTGFHQEALLTKKGVAAIRMMLAGNSELDEGSWDVLNAFSIDGASGSRSHDLVMRHWDRVSHQFDHYFRLCYKILFQAKSLLGSEETRYIELFRAQLSQEELKLISFHLLLDDKYRTMRKLANQYGLLKYLPIGALRNYVEQQISLEVLGKKFSNDLAI